MPRATRFPGPWGRFLIIALLAWSTLAPLPAKAQDAVEWLTGPALARRLAEPSDVEWSDNAKLRESLTRFSRAVRVAMVLDRRIDPNREMKLSAKNKPLVAPRSDDGILNAVVEYFNKTHAHQEAFPRPAPAVEGVQFGNVIYLGPRDTARNLRTLAEMRRDEVRKLPAAQAERWSARLAWRWDELATPRQVLTDLAKRAGVEITGLDEQLPHDVWPAGDLPAMPVLEHFTLLASQFDLVFHVEGGGGGKARLAKLTPEEAKLERTHDVPRNAKEIAEAWRQACPEAEIRLAGNKITVRGRLEDHEWHTNPGKSKITKPGPTTTTGLTAKGKTLYTLTIKNKTVRDVIRILAEQLKLTLKMDEEAIRAAGVNLDQLITLTVKDAPLEEMLKAALPEGLKGKVQGNVLEISPK